MKLKTSIVAKTLAAVAVALLLSIALSASALLVASAFWSEAAPAWEQSLGFHDFLRSRLSAATNLHRELEKLPDSDPELAQLIEAGEPWLAKLREKVMVYERAMFEESEALARLHEQLMELDDWEHAPGPAETGETAAPQSTTAFVQGAIEGQTTQPPPRPTSPNPLRGDKVDEARARLQREYDARAASMEQRREAGINLSNLLWQLSMLQASELDFALYFGDRVLTNRGAAEGEVMYQQQYASALEGEFMYHFDLPGAALTGNGKQTTVTSNVDASGAHSFAFTPVVNDKNLDGFDGRWLRWYALQLPLPALIAVLLSSAILGIVLLAWLIVSSGHRLVLQPDGSERHRLRLAWFDHLPQELMLLGYGFFLYLCFMLFRYILDDVNGYIWRFPRLSSSTVLYDSQWANAVLLRFASLAVIGLFAFILISGVVLLSEIRRGKLRALARTSLIGLVLIAVGRWLRGIGRRPRYFFAGIAWAMASGIGLLILYSLRRYDGIMPMLTFCFVILSAGAGILLERWRREAEARDALHEVTQRLAAGDVEARYQGAEGTVWSAIATDLASVGEGVRLAVDERMRSERLKTELITNVSHDLKTPLTSIINYIDLLQRPQISEAERNECIQVLVQKSHRLKRLTEDLVEVSQASSGVIQVELQPVDLVELLQQAVGEYEDRLQARQLTSALRLPPQLERYVVHSDSRHLWRILDNLMGNAAKYALPGSRVHLSLTLDDESWCIAVRNVSELPIDQTADELMERFVRGDRARSSEGSGLGLAIARSLAERLGGTLAIEVVDDVFTVSLRFPVDRTAEEAWADGAASGDQPSGDARSDDASVTALDAPAGDGERSAAGGGADGGHGGQASES